MTKRVPWNKGSGISWTPERWDRGYVDQQGRFRVYCPDFPGAWTYKTTRGYAYRAHVVWWLNTGELVEKPKQLHHVNKNRLDDRFENLAVVSTAEHSEIHAQDRRVEFRCTICDVVFHLPRHRLRERGRGKYCSQDCYHKAPVSPETVRRRLETMGLSRRGD